MRRLRALVGLLVQLSLCVTSARAAPVALYEVPFGDAGGDVVRFGDLDGDGLSDLVVAQNRAQRITCLTALAFDGRMLWQLGTPSPRNSDAGYDLPVQIVDLDGDGRSEVVAVMDGELQVREGAAGALVRSIRAPAKALDALYFAPLLERGSLAVVLKDRYRQFWVYDKSLNLHWTHRGSTGHYPFSYDFDGDGVEELLLGYRLYSVVSHTALWELKRPKPFKYHNDAVDIGPTSSDGQPRIAIACSQDSILVEADGTVRWSKTHLHSQHAVMLDLVPARPGEEIVFVDRGQEGSVFIYDGDGNQLATLSNQGRVTMASGVKRWRDDSTGGLVALFRRAGPPILVDGAGTIVETFPFATAKWPLLQHFDVVGDGREEILIHDSTRLIVFANGSPLSVDLPATERLPNRRIFNASAYVGAQ